MPFGPNDTLRIMVIKHIANLPVWAILSAYKRERTPVLNGLYHEQLKANLRNLECGFIELRCSFLCLEGKEQVLEEKALFIPEANLYDLMMLGIKYKQKAFLYKDKARLELLDTEVGKVLSFFLLDCSNNLKEVYTTYLEARTTTRIIVISLEEHHIPTLADSLKCRSEQRALAETTWIKIL